MNRERVLNRARALGGRKGYVKDYSCGCGWDELPPRPEGKEVHDAALPRACEKLKK